MQLNLTTDYAIRFLICLEKPNGVVCGPIIAEKTKLLCWRSSTSWNYPPNGTGVWKRTAFATTMQS